MSPMEKLLNATDTCFPRASGDEPRSHRHSVYTIGFSPRERG